MHARNEVPAQQSGQRAAIDMIGLYLRVGDQSRLPRIGHGDVGHFFNPLKHVVNASPVPARLDDRLRTTAQSLEKLNETRSGVALNPGCRQLPASFVLCYTNTITLVDIDA